VAIAEYTVSAEEKMAASQQPLQESVTDRKQQTLSSEMQLYEIQKILGKIDNSNANPAMRAVTEAKEASNVMIDNAQAKHAKPAMGKKMKNKMNMQKSMMGQRPMSQAKSMQTTDSLPGYPQAAHLYHLGAAEFFLDHTEQLSLSSQQTESLTVIKNEWGAYQEKVNVQIADLEQALWQATAQGQPDLEGIRKIIADIEALTAQLRLTFITRVGKAVTVLRAEQAALLTSVEKQP
tara:strand:+ start:18008 stop:18712 length:705 start_codon:yes stop_codon:yes gene_type:complete